MKLRNFGLVCLLGPLSLLLSCEAMYVREQQQADPTPSAKAPPRLAPRAKLTGPEKLFTVVRVHSGDLIELEDGTRVRYIGVIAPNPGESYFDESLAANRQEVKGKRVLLRYVTRQTTMTGELLAYVLTSADQFPERRQNASGYWCANSEMIRSGSARASNATRHFYRGSFLRAMMDAQEGKLGIWQD